MKIPIGTDILIGWKKDLDYIDKTLKKVSENPKNGHIPIWAREDRVTITRIKNQIDALITNLAPDYEHLEVHPE